MKMYLNKIYFYKNIGYLFILFETWLIPFLYIIYVV